MLQPSLCGEAQRLVGDAQHRAVHQERVEACHPRSLTQGQQLYSQAAVLLLSRSETGATSVREVLQGTATGPQLTMATATPHLQALVRNGQLQYQLHALLRVRQSVRSHKARPARCHKAETTLAHLFFDNSSSFGLFRGAGDTSMCSACSALAKQLSVRLLEVAAGGQKEQECDDEENGWPAAQHAAHAEG